MKNKVTIVLLLLSLVTKAQQYKLFAASTDKSIQLKWMSKSIENNTSFDIYRKENNGAWQKLNEKPIIPSIVIKESELKSTKNPYPKDEAYAFYIKYKNAKEASQNKQDYSDYSLAIAGVFSNDLAKHLGVFFEDNSVSKAKKYDYKVTKSGSEVELSSVGISYGDLANAPINLKVSQEKQNALLIWKGNEEFIGYNLYKNGEKNNEQPIMLNLETDKDNQVQTGIEDLKPGTYRFFVKGITFLNTESKPSEEITFTIKDLTPPSGITKFTATLKENEVILKWKSSTDKAVKGYFVFKSTDNGKTFKKANETILAANSEQFSEVLKPEESGTIQYYIATVDQDENAANSIPTRVFIPDHQAPEIPKSVTSKIESEKITLSWKANTEKDLLGYRIFRGLKDDDDNSMLLLSETPQLATTFSDVFLSKSNNRFIYKITAIDKSFNESKKATVWVELPNTVAPTAPFLKEAVLKENQVELQWNSTQGENVKGYEVYRIFNQQKEKITAELIASTRFIDKTINSKGVYQYYIQAVDSTKLVSKPSNSLYVSTTDGISKSIRLNLQQDLRSKKVQITIEGITKEEVQSLKLFRKEGNTGFRIIPFTFSNTTFLDEASQQGKIYQYFVEVIDTNGEKRTSNKVSFNNP